MVIIVIPCTSLEAAKHVADSMPAAWYGVRTWPTHRRFYAFVPQL